ncbi:efflux RND transporter periplasmic adaptor subunit [Frigoriflavimonas asaccharolytica]|uniref:HlyD family secretion protein n=1 Tax=Frigoriflavimonas asaccharolytica TaxID=2735899 RepID=A0A8J8K9M2_9FLAO|nr:efflux RND transporter periplasmic adaptor subunit [Frigoriflavimonas asaccharolytica]NRS93826.1 HlyD family secretion protein [Frigoriflavimonas asaccharolytica]
MKKKKYIIISVLLVAILAIVGYIYMNKSSTEIVEAQTIVVKKANVTKMVTATGTIQPITQVEVGTQVSGVVEKIYVDYNSEVKQGQLIAELDKTNLQAAVTQAQAAYDNAVTQSNYTKTIYNRQQSLYKSQVISRSDMEQSMYEYQTAQGLVTQRLSDLQSTRTNLSYANIYSPINGVVLSKAIDEGQTVAASLSTPTLFTIAKDLEQMQVEANVDEADIGEVKQGQRVTFTVDAYLGETFEGVVTQVRLNPTVTSNVVTYTVVVKADNPDLKLKPGLTATISIYTLELTDVLTVEAKAISFEPEAATFALYNKQHNLEDNSKTAKAGESTLWVMDKNGAITAKNVKVGSSDGVNVQILSGVAEGEKLVYSMKSVVRSDIKTDDASSESPFVQKPRGGKK